MEQRAGLEIFDLGATRAGLSELHIGAQTTEEAANGAIRALTELNGCTVGLVCFSGETPWERHAEDEFLHVLEGEVEVTILGDAAARRGTARAGQVLVVPRGHWHRQSARARATLLFVTGTTDISTADDPRTSSSRD